MANIIRLEYLCITHKSGTDEYIVLLGDKKMLRALPIIIGASQTYSFQNYFLDKRASRPSTHEFIVNFARLYHIQFSRIMVAEHKEGVFFADLYCRGIKQKEVMDIRCSDAILISFYCDCPIFTTAAFLKKWGMSLDEEMLKQMEGEAYIEEEADGEVEEDEEDAELDEKASLREQLQKAISEEDYERAARIHKLLGDDL